MPQEPEPEQEKEKDDKGNDDGSFDLLKFCLEPQEKERQNVNKQTNKQTEDSYSTGGTTNTMKRDYVVIWYHLEVSDDIDELQISINVTGKDDDNVAHIVVDDDKRTSPKRNLTNMRVLNL